MALTTGTMTDEQRKSVALECLKAFDNGGVTSTGDGRPGRRFDGTMAVEQEAMT